MLPHIYTGALHKKLFDLFRIIQWICCRPVGESDKPLFFIFFTFIPDDFVSDFSKHSFKWRGFFGRIHIIPMIAVVFRLHMIRIGDGNIFPFYAQNITQHPV